MGIALVSGRGCPGRHRGTRRGDLPAGERGRTRPSRNGKGTRQRRTHVHSIFRVEQPEGTHPVELLRLAGPGERSALPGRVQPGLPHLPQRRPGLAAGAPPGPGPGRGAGLAQGPRPLAGRPHHHRRRAHRLPGPGVLPGGPETRHQPAAQVGHQRHAARRGGGPALRRPGRRVRGGREGPLRQVSRGERGPGRRGRRPAQPGMDLRPGPPAPRPFLFPHHHGSGLG